MRIKKMFAIIMILILAVSSFTACSKSGSSDVTKKDETVNDESSANSTEPSNEKVTLQLWHYFSAGNADVLNSMIEEFNTSQSGVEIVATYIARADLMKQYTLGAISGELPDIGMVDSPDMASYIEMGVFEDITSLVDTWGEIDNFYEGPLSSCIADGKIYGLPQNTNCLALFYNIDLLKKSGYTQAPKTWNELYEIAKACTTDKVSGFAMSAKASEEGTFTYIPWLYSTGADVNSLDSAEAISSMTFLAKLVEEGAMSKEVVNWGQTDVYESFLAGNTAMMQNGSWQIETLKANAEAAGINWGCAYLPSDKENATVLGGENFGICAGADSEAAFTFFQYMMGTDGNAQFNLAAGKFPVRSDSMAKNDLWTTDPFYKVFAESMDFAVARGPHAQWPTISQGIYSALQAVILGEKTPEEAMKEAAEVVNSVY